MRKLLLAAIVASLGLARAAEPPATPQAGAEPKLAGAEKTEKTKKPPRKAGAKPKAKTANAPEKSVPPAQTPAAKPEPAKPCEPVKPCPIDG